MASAGVRDNTTGKKKHNNNSPTSQTLAMEKSIRHKHDMADARAMMAAQGSSSRTGGGKSSRSLAGVVSPAKVKVAMEALDRAEALHVHRATRSTRHEQLRQALALYQEAIKILLQYLKQANNDNNSGGIDRTTLQARIQTALTDAEKVKAQLQKYNNNGTTTSPATTTQQPAAQSSGESDEYKASQSGSFASLGGLFSVFNGPTTSSPTSSSPSAAASQSPNNTTPEPNNSARPKAPASRPTSTRSLNNNNHKKHSPPAAARQPPKRRQSPTSVPPTTPQHAALQNQILDEFYIPSSTLQKTTWDDVAGLQPVKQALQESVILPLQRPDLFQGLRRPQNLLLYGPPGTGKTLLVRAAASTSRALLFQCSAASLTSKWMGEAEKVVRALFQVAAAAAQQHQTPALLFLDEVDSVLSNRSENEHEASRRLKTEFMIQMEGLAKHSSSEASSGQNVLVLACTNCPWDLDPAVLRRFPRRLYVPLPDLAARQALLHHLLETQLKNDHSLTSRDVRELAQHLEGYSGSDMNAVASEAAFGPVREVSAQQLAHVDKLRPVSKNDWNAAIRAAPPPSVSAKLLEQYKQWAKE